MFNFRSGELSLNLPTNNKVVNSFKKFIDKYLVFLIFIFLVVVSCVSFYVFYKDGLGLAYNDARSHLDIGRRVVEGLKPGMAQLGSVWLPLPHILMIPTIWNNFIHTNRLYHLHP